MARNQSPNADAVARAVGMCGTPGPGPDLVAGAVNSVMEQLEHQLTVNRASQFQLTQQEVGIQNQLEALRAVGRQAQAAAQQTAADQAREAGTKPDRAEQDEANWQAGRESAQDPGDCA